MLFIGKAVSHLTKGHVTMFQSILIFRNLFFRPKFQGNSPENMARNMVRLRTSIQSDPEDLPLIQNANCCFVVPWDPEKNHGFLMQKTS